MTAFTNGGFWLWGDYNNKVEIDNASGAVKRVFHQNSMSGKEKAE